MSSNKIVAAQDRNNTNSNLVDLLSFIQIALLSVLKQYSHEIWSLNLIDNIYTIARSPFFKIATILTSIFSHLFELSPCRFYETLFTKILFDSD